MTNKLEMNMIDTIKMGSDVIEIWQYGTYEFEVRYVNHGISFFGTLIEVMMNLQDTYRVFDN